jgi:serine phosphatase RsbU (regulator of sigma subunit)/pSer/pThr/pTyr-binding forkhead associated (FHA) protein
MPEIIVQSAEGGRQRHALAKEQTAIGRSRESDIFLPDQWLSRHHAEIRRRQEGFFIADLKSKNGTLLNGHPIQDERRLRHGDVITLGEHTLTFSTEDATEEDEEKEPEGTRVFSARELSDINTKPAVDPLELARQNRLLGILKNATGALLAHQPLDELFDKILGLLLESVPAERGAIVLVSGQPPQMVIKAERSRTGRAINQVSRAIAKRVMQERVSLLLPRIFEDKSFDASDSILSSGIRSAMCAPLWYVAPAGGADSVIGLVYMDTLEASYSFGEEDLRILTALANVAAAKIETARLLEEQMERRALQADANKAAEIQRNYLPSAAPRVPGYGLCGSNAPSLTVGGDYYDYALEDGRLLMALGDVAGKGMGAALIMAVLRATVRAFWAGADLAEAVVRINRTVCQNVPDNKYVTFFLAALDPPSGRLSYVNAGHNPPLLVRANGEVETLPAGGIVLGMFPDQGYTQGTAEVRPGDTLVVYSDGVTETFDPEGREFGEAGLVEITRRGRGLDASALQDEILREIDRFARGGKATDDRTLIVLKRF